MAQSCKRQEGNWRQWEKPCLDALQAAWSAESAAHGGKTDSAHDIAHIRRVEAAAIAIGTREGANLDVLLPAVWLHDLVNLPKNHPDRAMASRLSADGAGAILNAAGYPAADIPAVAHAIAAHSFSAAIPPQTLEAKVLQDADRLDAVGAIGIARCFAVSGALGRPLLHPDDPLCTQRAPDDAAYAVDHFFVKLLRLPEMMQTVTGKEMAQDRADFMRLYLDRLAAEQTGVHPAG